MSDSLIVKKQLGIFNSSQDESIEPSLNRHNQSPHLPVLSLENSIRILNKYCIRLPSDALTQLTPRCLTLSQGNSYKCLIYLPINSGIHDPIESGWETSKELNEWLEPITKEIFYRLCR